MTAKIIPFPRRPPSPRLQSLLAEAFGGQPRPRPKTFTLRPIWRDDGGCDLEIIRPGDRP